MPDLLFVYGTLRSQFDNDWARDLRARGEFLGAASVMGSIFRVDHFPAYKNSPAGTVHGEVYEVPDSIFELLDEYEGDAFTRITVKIEDGREVWLYAYNGETRDSSRIASGDFTSE